MKNYSWILSCSLSGSITYYLLKNDIPHHIFGKDVKEFKFSDLLDSFIHIILKNNFPCLMYNGCF